VTRQAPPPGNDRLGLGVALALPLGLVVALGLALGLEVVALTVGLGVVLWNWAKNAKTAAEVQVRVPLVAVDPSTGSGVWSPSNAAHLTGNPARQPE